MENIKIEFLNFLLIGLPEAVALTLLTLALLRQKHHWPKIVLTGFTVALVVLPLRIANLNIGLHTAFAIIALALLVSYFFKISKLNSMVASFVSMLFLFLAEYLVFIFFEKVMAFDISVLAQDRLYWLICSWAHIVAMVMISFIFKQLLRNK